MTSAAVTHVSEIIAGISNNVGNTDSQNGEFAGIFQTATEKSERMQKEESLTLKTSATEKTMGISKKADELKNSQAEVQTIEKEVENAVEKELEIATKELKDEIAEKLDITVEELETVMETLGLVDASLFTQEGMTALVMEIEQISTPVELLTNAEAFQSLQELNMIAKELLTNVQDEFRLTDEQMRKAIAEFEKSEEPVQDVDVFQTQTSTDELLHADDVENNPATDDLQDVEAEVDGTKTETDVVMKENVLNNGKEAGNGDKGSEHQSGANHQVVTENSFAQTNTQNVNQTVADFSSTISEGNVSTQEIYEQIGEYIKTNIKPGTSEVEMQLNPENLGTVNIHLTAKQGNVTAQFTVQNELVKAALEVQLIQLKENFAQQGIKVDAVEVTVESHAFNQNMQQNNEENGQAQAEAKRSSTRSIHLNGDWMEEELTEEEQLVAEMMEADGNTVDYKA